MPHKQTRKVIRVGNSLAVTIPKPWAEYFALSEKDRVIVLSEQDLVITPILDKIDSFKPRTVTANRG
jgi:virulence-associated protein VagC